jgi:hypothetical protein
VQPGAPSAPTGAPQAANPAPGNPEEPEPATVEPPVAIQADLNTGIDTLDSYRLTMKLDYHGRDAGGQEHSGEMILEQQFIRASGDQFFRISNTNSARPEENGEMAIYQVGGVTYMLGMGEGCMSFSGNEEFMEENPMAAADAFNQLNNLRLIERGVRVNGVVTDHYGFDETSFESGEFQDVEGEVWLAQQGGYVVKMTGKGRGPIEFGIEGDGEMEWEYELDDINQVTDDHSARKLLGPGCLRHPNAGQRDQRHQHVGLLDLRIAGRAGRAGGILQNRTDPTWLDVEQQRRHDRADYADLQERRQGIAPDHHPIWQRQHGGRDGRTVIY